MVDEEYVNNLLERLKRTGLSRKQQAQRLGMNRDAVDTWFSSGNTHAMPSHASTKKIEALLADFNKDSPGALSLPFLAPPSASPEPGRTSADIAQLETLSNVVEKGYYQGKVPFIVLGSGASDQLVPYLTQMAGWLVKELEKSTVVNDSASHLLDQGRRLSTDSGSRNDAAEFFSTLQDVEAGTAFEALWTRFCKALVLGPFDLDEHSQFKGLSQLKKEDSTLCHQGIAGLLTAAGCNVLHLNFDPLLYRAFELLRAMPETRSVLPQPEDRESMTKFNLISLHNPKDVAHYYCSIETEFQPAVANARGDVFYVRCQNRSCPEYDASRPLNFDTNSDHPLRCPACHLDKLRIELSFPGYQSKELLVQPMLAELYEYIGGRASAIVVIGLSGRWDPYLLADLFHWATVIEVPIVDVKPPDDSGKGSDLHLEKFRGLYFPGVPQHVVGGKAGYFRWTGTANDFLAWLYPVADKCIGPLPQLPAMRAYSQMSLTQQGGRP